MNVLNIKNIDDFKKEMKKRFLEKVSGERFFRLSATPASFRDINLSVNMSKVKEVLMNPPYKRESGWTMKVIGNFVTTLEGIENDDYEWRHLKFLKNGHLEFWARVDDSFCWRQNEDEMKINPRLYPYAVCEYPVSFFYLLRGLIDSLPISSDYAFEGGFYNCKGAYMRPGHPNSIIYRASFYKPVYWEHNDLEFRERPISTRFDAEQEAYRLVTEIYNAFGISDEKGIPFFDQNGKFSLGE